jgi:hypothetical protein
MLEPALQDGVGGGGDQLLDVSQLLDLAHQRDHDLGDHVPLGMTLLNVARAALMTAVVCISAISG